MVCEVVSGYICNMEMYSAEGKKLEDNFITFRQKLRPKSSHEDKFYKCEISTNITRQICVCGTMRANRGTQSDLEGVSA
jgi:hypothetical protein